MSRTIESFLTARQMLCFLFILTKNDSGNIWNKDKFQGKDNAE